MAINIEKRPSFSKQSSPRNSLESYYRFLSFLFFLVKITNTKNEHIKQVKANIYLLNALTSNYSYFVPILTLRRDNSGIVLRKVRILTLRNKVRIPTLRRTIPELYRFLLCAEHIHCKDFRRFYGKITSIWLAHLPLFYGGLSVEELRRQIHAAILEYDELLTLVKKRKIRWFGHVLRSSGLAKTILQGTVTGKRRGRQKKRWEDNMNEWTGMDRNGHCKLN